MFVFDFKIHLKVLQSLEINKKLWILNYLEFEFLVCFFKKINSNKDQINSIRYF